MSELYQKAGICLKEAEIARKLALVDALGEDWRSGRLPRPEVLPEVSVADDVLEAGRPEKPGLVPPKEVPRRRLGTVQGQAAMIHAIAHIEFNAINLALDAVYRFRGLPEDYYSDWIQVAVEEVYHFRLIQQRLAKLGYTYGDFPAHAGLWELAQKTAHDPLLRMALVPRFMEARGLDVSPGISAKFAGIGDQETVALLKIILEEEVGHVAAGTRWFQYLCGKRGLEPEQAYFQILKQSISAQVVCPLHLDARRQAGFSESELAELQKMCAG